VAKGSDLVDLAVETILFSQKEASAKKVLLFNAVVVVMDRDGEMYDMGTIIIEKSKVDDLVKKLRDKGVEVEVVG